MPRLVVVFDSNAYRGLSDIDAASLMDGERSVGVIAVASTLVCAELMSHLVDAGDKSYASAWGALRRLAPHCAYFDGSRRIIRFHAGADEQICRSLFGRPPRQIPGIDRFGQVIGSIAGAEVPGDFAQHLESMRGAAEFVRANEERWSQTIASGMAEAFQDLAPQWRADLSERERRQRTAQLLRSPAALAPCARMFVNSASHLHQIEATEEELAQAATKCESMFPVPLRFYNAIVARLIESPEYNLTKRANLVWDLQLAFTVSPSLRAFGAPVWLVTSDRALSDAAEEAGAAHFVRSLDEYRSVVTGGVESLLDALAAPGEAA